MERSSEDMCDCYEASILCEARSSSLPLETPSVEMTICKA